MKKCKKLLAFTLAVLLAFACYAVPAFASSSASQYGLEATIVTDKESYKANEDIHVTVTVKNTNDFKVENVSMESLLPETLTLKDGDNSTKTVNLEPGETLTLSFTAVKEKEETSATEPESQSTEPTETEPVIPSESQTVKPSESESVKPTIGTINTAIDDSTTVFSKEVTEMNSATIIHSNNPNTGDITSIKTVVIAIIAVLALIAIILILLHKYQKQTTKIISLVMCIAVATTAITGVSFFTAKGTDDGRKSFTVEKVITVNGEEANVSADVKYQGIGTSEALMLTSNPRELHTSDTPQEVCFYAKTDLNVNYVTLLNAKTGEKVAKLLDDGLLESSGDITANDRIYSGKITIPCKEDQILEFYAVIEDDGKEIKSEKCEVEIIVAPNEERIEQMNQVDDKLSSIINSEDFQNLSDSKKKDTILKEFEDMQAKGLIQEFEFDEDEQMVLFKYSNGLSGFWHIKQTDSSLAGRSIVTNQSNIDKGTTKETIKVSNHNSIGRALILYGWDNCIEEKTFWNSYQSTQEEWINLGLDTVLKALPTVADLKSLLTEQTYNYIVIAEHGAEYKGKYAIGTQEKAFVNKDIEYWNDLNSKQNRVIRGDSQYFLTPEFFSYYYKDKLNDSIIDIESCMGFGQGDKEDTSFSSAFINSCKAKNVIGYHNKVWIDYPYYMSNSIVTGLIAKGYTISKAIEEAKKELGNTDAEFYTKYHPDSQNDKVAAYPIIKGTNDTKLRSVYTKGQGTINDPYQISNEQQLYAIRYNLKSNFVLVNDIDLSGYNWIPIPEFSGSFDGKGHAIKNLKMDYEIADDSIDKYFPETNGFSQRIASFGLFSEITNSSEVKNIDLEAMNIHIVNAIEKDSLPIDTELYIQVAGIAGASENSLINNCTTSGKIKLDDSSMKGIGYSIAGICALANSSQIINCTNIANVHVGVAAPHSIFDDVAIGGIISVSWGGDISRCINKGNINAIVLNKTTLHCGGILGYSNGKNKDDKMLPIQLCQNYGNIKVMGSDFIYAGGILGWSMARQLESNINYGDITSCANVYASSGGIVGQMGPSLDGWLWYEINKCVNYGDVSTEAIINPESAFTGTPNSHAGGISGKLADTGMSIENCYNLCSKIVSDTHDAAGNKFLFSLNRICSDCFEASRGYPILECYSLITTTLNGSIPTEDIGPDQKNGGSMTKAEIEKVIQELGFELPSELPNAS